MTIEAMLVEILFFMPGFPAATLQRKGLLREEWRSRESDLRAPVRCATRRCGLPGGGLSQTFAACARERKSERGVELIRVSCRACSNEYNDANQ